MNPKRKRVPPVKWKPEPGVGFSCSMTREQQDAVLRRAWRHHAKVAKWPVTSMLVQVDKDTNLSMLVTVRKKPDGSLHEEAELMWGVGQ